MFAKIRTGAVVAYPYTLAALRADFPNVSFPYQWDPTAFADFGIVAVGDTTPPAHDAITQGVREITPVFSGGQWVQVWEVYALSAGEIAANTAAAQDAADTLAAKQYAKLVALKSMSPAQISSWVDANVTNLAQAQDAIKTLAVAVGILARKL